MMSLDFFSDTCNTLGKNSFFSTNNIINVIFLLFIWELKMFLNQLIADPTCMG